MLMLVPTENKRLTSPTLKVTSAVLASLKMCNMRSFRVGTGFMAKDERKLQQMLIYKAFKALNNKRYARPWSAFGSRGKCALYELAPSKS